MNFLDSLQEAFSDAPDIPGPGPDRLVDLIELAWSGVQQGTERAICPYLRQMKERVNSARIQRERDYQACQHRYDTELVELVEGNLGAYRLVEDALEAALSAFGAAAGAERLGETLQSLQASTELLQATSEELTELHTCGSLICLYCGMPSKSLQCPHCETDCLYPDPHGQTGPQGEFQLPPCYQAIFTAYSKVLTGEGLLEELFDTLTSLESAFLEVESMVEQVLEDQPEDLRASILEDVLDDCLEGIAQMKAVEETRQLSDLNEGWSALVTSSVELYGLLPNLGLGTLA